MKFVIDRSKWVCGGDGSNRRGEGLPMMLNDEGFRCCLGHVGHQLGAADLDMLGYGDPETVDSEILCPVLVELSEYTGSYQNTELSSNGMVINDDKLVEDEEREAELVELFAKHGHEIEFTGEYVFPEEEP